MNNNLLQIKVKQRLNKLSSGDYDNIECWMIAEAFNKAQVEWCRRQQHGNNIFKESDEQSITRVDDLQTLITTLDLKGNVVDNLYFETNKLPSNYMRFKRVSIKGQNTECGPRPFKVYQGQEADVDELLSDVNSKPSFEWAETFCTLANNNIRIYTNNEFTIVNPKLTYYRLPKPVEFKGCININDETIFTTDQESELKDDIVELIIDEACSILAGDIESMIQMQRGLQSAERTN